VTFQVLVTRLRLFPRSPASRRANTFAYPHALTTVPQRNTYHQDKSLPLRNRFYWISAAAIKLAGSRACQRRPAAFILAAWGKVLC
jgi:hypothetical protein